MKSQLNSPARCFRTGFTLIEVLITITIIVVLAALSFVGMRKLKNSASAAADAGEMRQINAAVTLYASDNNDFLPTTNSGVGPNYSGKSSGLTTHLAPYMGYEEIEVDTFMKEFAAASWQSAKISDGSPSMLVMQQAYTGNGKFQGNLARPEPNITPFGYPGKNSRKPMQLAGALAQMSDPANRLMITEIDGLHPEFKRSKPSWLSLVPENLAHGTYRLGLYWDGHVGKLDVDLNPL